MNEFVPSEFYLGQNYPNPFKEGTTIKYCIAMKTKVKLIILNSEGELVRELENEEKQPGTYQIKVDASSLLSGTYFYRLEAGDYLSEKKMIFQN